MKWFKHQSNMRHDVKIRRLINKHGAEGYAVYVFILESITDNLTTENPLPDLEDCSTDIAEYLKMDSVKIEEIMLFCMQQGLFEQCETSGRILCHKIYKFIEKSITRSDELRKMIDNYNKGSCLELSETVSDKLDRTEDKITEQNKKEYNRVIYINKIDLCDYWNTNIAIYGKIPKLRIVDTIRYDKYKLRINEGFKFNDIIIEIKKSNFLQGENKDGWKITYTWLFKNSENWKKVIEGNYQDKKNHGEYLDVENYKKENAQKLKDRGFS